MTGPPNMRLELTDIDASAGPQAASERLFELALRCGAQRDGELPWHLAVHLAREAAREAAAAGPEHAWPAPASEAALVAQALGRALGAHLRGVPSDEQAGRLVGWLVPLLRVDRCHGVDALGALCAGRTVATAAAVREIIGVALARMLAQLDPSAAPADGVAPSLARDLVTIGAFSLDGGPEGPGGPAWAAILHGVFRHLTALGAAAGPAAVAHWIRLCPSRAALRYVAGLEVVRGDAVLLATLVLHGGPREVAVGLAALSAADPDGAVCTAVAAFTRRAPRLSYRRADWLIDQIRQLGRPDGPLGELREAVLDRMERSTAPEAPLPVTDGLLRPARGGVATAAALAGRPLPHPVAAGLLRELLTAVTATLRGDDPALTGPDPEWTGAVARGLRGAFRGADPDGQGPDRRRAVRKQVLRALAALESGLNRPSRAAEPSAQRTITARALAALALRLARSLPEEPDAAAFAQALYELALRLRVAGAAAPGDPLWGAPGPHFPDPRDATQADALESFLETWRAADQCRDVTLPAPDVAPVATGHTLGVARLPGSAAPGADGASPGADPAAAAAAGGAAAGRPSLLRRLRVPGFSGRRERPIL